MTDPTASKGFARTPDVTDLERVRRTRQRITLKARLIATAGRVDRMADDDLTTLEAALDLVDGAPGAFVHEDPTTSRRTP